MPTLFRFLTTLAILAGLVYGAMYVLATSVEPRRTQLTVPVPIEQVDPMPVATPGIP